MMSMEQLTLWMFVFIGIMTALVAVVVWSPRKFWIKIIALILSVAFLACAYIVFGDLLSRPKPVGMELLYKDTEQAIILGAKIEEDKGIYLLLQLPLINEPRYYVLPWDKDLALQLQEALRGARERRDGRGIPFFWPFKKSLERRDLGVEHPFPQLALPEKTVPNAPPRVVLPRNREAPRNREPPGDD